MANELVVKRHPLSKKKPTVIISEITQQNLQMIAAVESLISEILAGRTKESGGGSGAIRGFELIYSELPDQATIRKDFEEARAEILDFLAKRVHKDFLKFIVVDTAYGVEVPKKTVHGSIHLAPWGEGFLKFIQKIQKEGKLALLLKFLGK